jgi:hypothetical protein
VSTPTDATLIKWFFTLTRAGTHEDVAEFGLWIDNDGGAEYGDTQLHSIAIGAEAAWAGHVSNGQYCDNVALTSTSATAFLSTGHILFEQVYVPGSPWQGAATGPALPWETSLAISLYTYPRGTFVSNGKRKRGRYYLPPMAASVLDSSNSGFVSNSLFAGLLGDQKTFLGHVGEDMVGVPVGTLSVFSRADSVLRHVSQISGDAKIDSQRRRQNRETAGTVELSFP